MSLHCLLRRAHFVLLVSVAIASNAAAAHIPGTVQLGGFVYVDRNNDGHLAFLGEPNPEYVIADVTVSLFSKVNNIETLVATTQTDSGGRYFFENFVPGTYVLRETQPIEFVDGKDTVGFLQSLNGQPIPPSASPGTAGNDFFTNIVLPPDVGAELYNFGELGLAAGFASKRILLSSWPPPPFVPEPGTWLLLVSATLCGWLTTARSR